jgi:hypothetical protein
MVIKPGKALGTSDNNGNNAWGGNYENKSFDLENRF